MNSKLYISILITFLITSCSSDDSGLEEPVIIIERYSPVYNVIIDIYSYEIEESSNRSYLKGILKIDCHSCRGDELYDFSILNLCLDDIPSTLVLRSDTIASVFPSIIYKGNKSNYEIPTTWSFENKLPKNLDNLVICFANSVRRNQNRKLD